MSRTKEVKYKRRSPQNETLFGPPGHFYVYMVYGTYHCVNVVTERKDWANGVLLRAIAIPNEPERVAAGPGLLAKRMGLNRSHNNLAISTQNDVWISNPIRKIDMLDIVRTTRIGISKAQELPWRWYLHSSGSVSKRAKGDVCPPKQKRWHPLISSAP